MINNLLVLMSYSFPDVFSLKLESHLCSLINLKTRKPKKLFICDQILSLFYVQAQSKNVKEN